MRPYLLTRSMLPLAFAFLFVPWAAAYAQSKPASKNPPQSADKPAPKPAAKVWPFKDKGDVLAGAGGKWGGRARGRMRVAARFGGVAEAIGDGLAWLAKHQDRDGGWSATSFMKHDTAGKRTDRPGEHLGRVGITSMCLLAFLGDGSTLRSGPYKKVVESATRFLFMCQKENGSFTRPNQSNALLEHALATYAFSESYGLSRAEVLRKNVVRAVMYLAEHQNKDGGFGRATRGAASDMFTTCHAALACKAARDFRVFEAEAFERVARVLRGVPRWIDKVTKKDGSITAVGDVQVAGGPAVEETAVAAALWTRFFLGQDPKKVPEMQQAADITVAASTDPESGGADQVFWYLGGYSSYQMGGAYFGRWQPLLGTVMESQRDDGNFKGSWDPAGKGAAAGGRVYATALCVLTLEVFYRYTKLVR